MRIAAYQATVTRPMGGDAATPGFLRLFMVPGRDRWRAGAGRFPIDCLAAMENRVEYGQAPGTWRIARWMHAARNLQELTFIQTFPAPHAAKRDARAVPASPAAAAAEIALTPR